MKYSDSKEYREKLITEIETMISELIDDKKEDKPKLRVVK